MKITEPAKLELMAPAGSYAALTAAIRTGADAVYFGLDSLNMRAGSGKSFAVADLGRIVRICRWCGVKSCLALNTLVYGDDLESLDAICLAAARSGVDAVIASDIAAIQIVREHGLSVHISVQANVSNIRAVRFYSQWADVIVLARELTLDQISDISRRIEEEDIRGPAGHLIRLEIFAHGALCVAISGKCYMSLHLYNKSANRGECLQACRRKYRIQDAETGDELDVEGRHVMSPRDICTLDHLDRLAQAGASVFKIEGRARSANYVSTVTRAYRAALDAVEDGTFSSTDFAPERERLERVFNRGFWDGGYYCGQRLGEWSEEGHSRATRVRVQLGVIKNCFQKAQAAEFELWQKELHEHSELLIEGPTTGAFDFLAPEIRVDGEKVERAVKGDRVTVAVPRKVRRNDKVFLLVMR